MGRLTQPFAPSLICTNFEIAPLFEAETARQRCWYVDSKGLVVKNRDHLTRQKQPFAHEHLAHGRVDPRFQRIREVSAAIAMAVAEEAYRLGLARRARPADLLGAIKESIYEPVHRSYA